MYWSHNPTVKHFTFNAMSSSNEVLIEENLTEIRYFNDFSTSFNMKLGQNI